MTLLEFYINSSFNGKPVGVFDVVNQEVVTNRYNPDCMNWFDLREVVGVRQDMFYTDILIKGVKE